MSQQTLIAELGRSIELNTPASEKAKALARLALNPDFKKIIIDGYLRDEAVRLVHLKADPAMQTPDKQASVIRQVDSIGNLSAYFTTIRTEGMMADKSISDAETDRIELMNGKQ